MSPSTPLLARISTKFLEEIERLSDDELKRLRLECVSLTQSNCWLLMYELRIVVSDHAANILRIRNAAQQPSEPDAGDGCR